MIFCFEMCISFIYFAPIISLLGYVGLSPENVQFDNANFEHFLLDFLISWIYHIFGLKLKTPSKIVIHYSPAENVCKMTGCIKIKKRH